MDRAGNLSTQLLRFGDTALINRRRSGTVDTTSMRSVRSCSSMYSGVSSSRKLGISLRHFDRKKRLKHLAIKKIPRIFAVDFSNAKHILSVLERYDFNTDIPEWNDEGTISTEERVLITQSMKEVNQIMESYVGIVRSNTRLTRAWNRLDILYEETESLFKRSKASKELCELRNMINVGYLITRQAMERKESREIGRASCRERV